MTIEHWLLITTTDNFTKIASNRVGGGGRHSTEVAVFLLTQQPQV